jgi:hypothetical protein
VLEPPSDDDDGDEDSEVDFDLDAGDSDDAAPEVSLLAEAGAFVPAPDPRSFFAQPEPL